MKRPNIQINKCGNCFLVAIFNARTKVFEGPKYVGEFNRAERIYGCDEDWPVRDERLSYRLNARFADSRIADKNGY